MHQDPRINRELHSKRLELKTIYYPRIRHVFDTLVNRLNIPHIRKLYLRLCENVLLARHDELAVFNRKYSTLLKSVDLSLSYILPDEYKEIFEKKYDKIEADVIVIRSDDDDQRLGAQNFEMLPSSSNSDASKNITHRQVQSPPISDEQQSQGTVMMDQQALIIPLMPVPQQMNVPENTILQASQIKQEDQSENRAVERKVLMISRSKQTDISPTPCRRRRQTISGDQSKITRSRRSSVLEDNISSPPSSRLRKRRRISYTL